MKKIVLTLTLLSAFGFSSKAQNVNIPDVNFKAYLVGNSSINTTPDSEISLSEAAAYNATINCAGLGITDMTGIEAFTGYITVNCSGNLITTLDFSANTHLGGMLEVGYNPLTSLVLPSNITSLKCQNTQLTTLDLTPAAGLTNMWSMMTPFTSIDFSNSAALIGMNIDGNHMTTIDLSSLTSLQWINATQTYLTALDVSVCPALNSLNCSMSDFLTELNVANGNNMSFAPGSFDATLSPLLTCVTVDNVSFANAVWNNAVDNAVSFSLNCAAGTPLATSLTIQGQGGVNTITTDGGTLQIVSTILPVAAAGQTVWWGIAVGASLASIDANGMLTAIDNGSVTVGGLTSDGTNLSANTVITISNQVLGLTSMVDSKFNLYPNPAISHLMITTENQIESISIFNMLGELVQQENESAFSVENLMKGIYLINVTTTFGLIQTRFVKE
jgi:hypothetical protein